MRKIYHDFPPRFSKLPNGSGILRELKMTENQSRRNLNIPATLMNVSIRSKHSSKRRRGNGGVSRAAAGRNGFKWLKPAENKFTKSAFTSFSCKFLQIYLTSVSGCLSFTFKTCRIVAGASMIR